MSIRNSAKGYRVSVIIPVYNKEDYVSACLGTVLKQTLEGVEIICINDGSTDGSMDILKEAAKLHRDIRVIDQENMGVAHSRNVGISAANGDFICFMDPDDMYPDSRVLEDLYEAAEGHGVDVCGGSFSSLRDGKTVSEYGGLNGRYVFDKDGIMEYSEYQFDFGFQRFIYRADFIRGNSIRFPPYVRFQDPPFLTRALSAAGRFYALRRATYLYREAYKEVGWNLVKKVDMLRGLRDNAALAAEKGYDGLLHLTMERLTSPYYQGIVCFDNDRFERRVLSDELVRLRGYSDTEEHGEAIDCMVRRLGEGLWSKPCTPLVSVVIPVYNVSAYLEACIDSVLGQTIADMQIICVDDGSTDDSGEICDRYASRDERVSVIHKKNGGLSSARNRGADIAVGKYLYFLDSDDMLTPDALESMVGIMDENSLDVLYFDAETLFESKELRETHKMFEEFYRNRGVQPIVMDGRELMGSFLDADTYRTPVQLCFLRMSFYRRNNLTNYNGILHEDNLFTFQCLEYAERAMYVNHAWYIRRIRGDSIITSKKSFRNYYGYSITSYEMTRHLVESGAASDNPGWQVLENTLRTAGFTLNEITNSERSKVNLMTIDDKIKLSSVGAFTGSEQFLVRSSPIVTFCIRSTGSYECTLNAVINQTLWEIRCILVTDKSPAPILEKYRQYGVEVMRSVEDALSSVDSPYVAVLDSDVELDGRFAGMALERLRASLKPSIAFTAEGLETSASGDSEYRVVVARAGITEFATVDAVPTYMVCEASGVPQQIHRASSSKKAHFGLISRFMNTLRKPN